MVLTETERNWKKTNRIHKSPLTVSWKHASVFKDIFPVEKSCNFSTDPPLKWLICQVLNPNFYVSQQVIINIMDETAVGHASRPVTRALSTVLPHGKSPINTAFSYQIHPVPLPWTASSPFTTFSYFWEAIQSMWRHVYAGSNPEYILYIFWV